MTTYEENVAAESAARAEFEARTVAFVVEDRAYTMADARVLFDRYHPGDWKSPVDARNVPYAVIFALAEAIVFYHGGTYPKIVPEPSGSGVDRGYRVSNNGYAA
jgi:hypothetical protein